MVLLPIGDIQSFITYVRSFNQPISFYCTEYECIAVTAAAAERVFEFLDETEEIPETSTPDSF